MNVKKKKKNNKPKNKVSVLLILIGKPIYLAIFLLLKTLVSLSKNKRHKQSKKTSLRILATCFFLIWVSVSLLISIPIYTLINSLPDAKDINKKDPKMSTRIYDRNKNILYTVYKDENRSLISLDKVPMTLRLATLAAEDANFYNHNGVSPKGILRSLTKIITTGKIEGGSTITQQLVKNKLLTPEKTISRKVKEIILAIQVEKILSKDEILQMYLNEVPYGQEAFGIKEAATLYFNTSVEKLDLAQSSLLAGIPKSPSVLSPLAHDQARAKQRQVEVLSLMLENNFISKEEKDQAENEKVNIFEKKSEIKAPHFVMYVKNIISQKYGQNTLESGGLEIVTTLDKTIQEETEKIVLDEVQKLKHMNITNAAAIVMDVKTGEILAMVGSKDYFANDIEGNVNVLTSERPPGSTVKVINYSYALQNGYTLASVLDDTPKTFQVKGSKPYTPKNYDGKYRGKITLKKALAESRNIPAVSVLASYGVDKMITLGKKMGITSWENTSRYGLSLTLGGGEIRPIDLATVYATIANKGYKTNPTAISQIANQKKEKIYENDCQAGKTCPNKEAVIDERVAFLITQTLKDEEARLPSFGRQNSLKIAGHNEVAVKTGTSNDLRDNFTVGYSKNTLVLVWVGNNDNSRISSLASGVTGAAPIWNKILSRTLELRKEVPSEWEKPTGVVELAICEQLGSLACGGCKETKEWFLEENHPTTQCSNFFFTKENKNQKDT